MHVAVDLNGFLQFVVPLFLLVFGLLYLIRNTASRYFTMDSNFDSSSVNKKMATAPSGGGAGSVESCAVCGSLTNKRCGRCKMVKYCSEACQRSHWYSEHWTKCKDVQTSSKANFMQSTSALRGKKIVNRYNVIYNKRYTDRPSGWSDENLKMRAHEDTFKSTFQYENVRTIVKSGPMYTPQSSGQRSANKARTSESSGAHSNTTVDVEYNEPRSRSMRHNAAKRKCKKMVSGIDESSEAMQQSVSRMEEYNNNKKVGQLIQAHKLMVMDTRGMADEQLHNHRVICEQLRKRLNM